jgi:two-component system nitrogen regulation response regulator NtrX
MNRQAESVRHAHVLILDDDEDVAHAMQDVLQPRDHEVRVVHNLDDAWSELTARAPDVFIVDLYIGARRSDQLIETIREALPQVRCILVSGSERGAWAHLLERGIVDQAVQKPLHVADLIALVEAPNGKAKR